MVLYDCRHQVRRRVLVGEDFEVVGVWENDEVVSLRERARKRNVRFRFIGIGRVKKVKSRETTDDNYYCC